jgi:hypothetical protein
MEEFRGDELRKSGRGENGRGRGQYKSNQRLLSYKGWKDSDLFGP